MIERIKSIWQMILLIPFVIVWGIISTFQPGAGVRSFSAGAVPSDFLTMTVGALIALVIGKYIAEWVAYGLTWLNVPDKWRVMIEYIGNLVLVALVSGVAHFIPQTVLDKPVIDALFAAFSFLLNVAGGHAGTSSAVVMKLAVSQQMKASGLVVYSAANPLKSV